MLTRREVFEKVKNHLLTQNAVSKEDGQEICAYYASDGKKCAVGCLINPETYSPDMEGGSVMNDSLQEALLKSGVNVDAMTLDMLDNLRIIHDNAATQLWPEELNKLEIKFLAKNYFTLP